MHVVAAFMKVHIENKRLRAERDRAVKRHRASMDNVEILMDQREEMTIINSRLTAMLRYIVGRPTSDPHIQYVSVPQQKASWDILAECEVAADD